MGFVARVVAKQDDLGRDAGHGSRFSLDFGLDRGHANSLPEPSRRPGTPTPMHRRRVPDADANASPTPMHRLRVRCFVASLSLTSTNQPGLEDRSGDGLRWRLPAQSGVALVSNSLERVS